jgi:hypothetical protein
MKSKLESYLMNWNGMLLEVTAKLDFVSSRLTGEEHAHLRIRSLYPANANLPIARSQSLPMAIITAAGGPAAYVDVMLDIEMSLQQAA